MQLTLHLPKPNQHWDVIQGILGYSIATSKTCHQEKSRYSINFVKKIRPPRNSDPVNYDFPAQLSNNQRDR